MSTNTFVDISALGNLQPTKPLDLTIPETATKKAGPGFPPAGRYIVRAPDITGASFGATKAGNLKARVSPTIVGPTHEGYEIRFQDIYATPYTDRDGKETSSVAQYLQAFGIEEELTGDPQQAANLIASTAGKTAEVYANWVAEHYQTGFKLVGMKNFPLDAAGKPQPWVEHPDENVKGSDGQRLRLRAHLEVTRWLAAPKQQ
jgi:hypothetical protein